LTSTEYVGKVTASSATGKYPELKPVPAADCERGTQGALNELATTEWFFWWNSKRIVSPTLAWTLVGLNARMPVPPTTTLICLGVVDDGVVGAAVVVDAGVDAVDEGAAAPIAAALKASIFWPGLMAKTIPADEQWVPCLQYTQTGSVLVTLNSATWNPEVTSSATGMKPESKPPGALTQGAAKVDWVAV